MTDKRKEPRPVFSRWGKTEKDLKRLAKERDCDGYSDGDDRSTYNLGDGCRRVSPKRSAY